MQPFSQLNLSKILLVGVFSLAFLLQEQVPTMADDLCRYQPELSLTGTLEAVSREYQNWTGRYLVIGLNYIAFSAGDIGIHILNLLNALWFTFAVFLCSRLIPGDDRRGQAVAGVLFLVLISLVPVRMGEIWLWKTGAIQYFWGSTMALALIYALYNGLSNRFLKGLCCVLAFVLGTWLESLSAACFAVVCLMLAVEFINTKQLPAPWKLLSAALLGLGLATLVVAPGNYARVDAIGDPRGIVEGLQMAMLRIPAFVHPVLLAVALLFIWLNRNTSEGRGQLKLAGWLALTGIGTTLMMSFAPPASFVVRAGFPQEFFLICATCALFPMNLSIFQLGYRYAFSGTALIALGIGYGVIFSEYRNLSYQQNARNQLTDMAIEYNATSLVALPPLYLGGYSSWEDQITDKWFFVRDIRQSPGDWRNVCYAKAHGVEAVQMFQFSEQ